MLRPTAFGVLAGDVLDGTEIGITQINCIDRYSIPPSTAPPGGFHGGGGALIWRGTRRSRSRHWAGVGIRLQCGDTDWILGPGGQRGRPQMLSGLPNGPRSCVRAQAVSAVPQSHHEQRAWAEQFRPDYR